jgi:BCD family chlorophyll transporter-like MFS transporter
MIWADSRTRRFFVFLFIATFAAWMQDNILEPYGGDVFKYEVAETTRLSSYWGAATVLFLIPSFIIWRRRRPEEQSGVSRVGLVIMALGMILLAGSALGPQEGLLITGLVVFGAGFGLFTFGGLSLMAAMSPDPHSGAYLGLWTVAMLVSKGLGTFTGGLIRDILLLVQMKAAGAYATIFGLSALGLVVAAMILVRIDFQAFVRDSERPVQAG